jgi:IS30 family transposase
LWSEVLAALRQGRKTRRPRARGIDRRGQIPNVTPIAARPAEVVSRTVLGHWEGDLMTEEHRSSKEKVATLLAVWKTKHGRDS